MPRLHLLRALFALLLAFSLTSCGSNSSQPPLLNSPSGTVFVVGTDGPPVGSVLAFQVTLTGLTASDGTHTATLISDPQTIEFSRLNGLHTLLDFQSVTAGTYTSITATLSAPVISYLDTAVSPPKVNTLNGTLTQSGITVTLPQPLVVSDGGLVGLLFDFRLRDSLELDGGGQLTGRVTPNLDIRAIPSDALDAEIDELRGGVVSVDLANKKFVLQGPHGRQLTVVTDDQTHFETGEGLDQLDTNTIAQVSGSLQRVTLTLKASEVLILTKDRFLLGGLITGVRPPSGTANQIDLLVRSELPDISGVQIGQITTLGFDGNERFMIHDLRLPISAFLFNRDALAPGQRISAGGVLNTSSGSPSLDVRRVWLHQQGVEGAWVPGSTNRIAGTFSLDTSGLADVLFGRPVKVFTSALTRFAGLNDLGDLTGGSPIRLRVVGLVLKDAGGSPVIVARVVQKL